MPSSTTEFFIEDSMLVVASEQLAKAQVRTRTSAYGRAMNASLAANANTLAHAGYDAEVASVGVMDGDKLLMGKRKDNGKWTLPGGHLEKRETPHDGALRELYEESGIVAQQLDPLGCQGVIGRDGSTIMVHAFMLTAKPDVTTKLDPDGEFSELRWVDTTHGLPKEIEDNLHSPQNVVLHRLGIQKSLFIVDEPGFTIDEPSHVIKGALFDAFTIDLVKARPHKYLRKYKGRNGEWIYVYHEGEQRGRQIPEEAMGHIKTLADTHNDEHARALLSTLQEHAPEKLDMLRKLATQHNDEPAQRHLEHLGVDWHGEHQAHLAEQHERDQEEQQHQQEQERIRRDQKKAKEAERGILSAQRAARQREKEAQANPLTRTLPPADAEALHEILDDAIRTKISNHLEQHPTSPVAQALTSRGLDRTKLMQPVKEQKTVQGALKALHESLKQVDVAHNGIVSQNTTANAAGGYGNLAYNAAVDALVNRGFLPQEAREHRRTAANRGGNLEINADEMRAAAQRGEERRQAQEAQRRLADEQRRRQEEERRVREEAERAAVERELGGSMAMHMASIMDNGQRLSATETRSIHMAMKNIFGGDGLKKEHWPYDFSAHGLKTKIKSVRASGSQISFELQVYNAQGQPMMEGWSRTWHKDHGGKPTIENNFMSVDPNARSSVQVGNLINQGQRNLMRSVPGGGRVRVHANCDIGGYNWCNQGFSWNRSEAVSDFRYRFKQFARQHGVELTDEDMAHFKEPVHFAAFDDGKTHVVNLRDLPRNRGNAMPLSAKQKESGSLSGKAGEHPLSAEEIRSGKTNRMAMHLGKKFMLGTDWYGTWDSSRDTEASKFADAYYSLRDRAAKHLSSQYKAVGERVRGGARRPGATEPAPAPNVPRSSFGSQPAPAETNHAHADRYLRYWAPRSGGNMVMTPRRLNTISTWQSADIKAFMARAPLTRQARERVRQVYKAARARPTT